MPAVHPRGQFLDKHPKRHLSAFSDKKREDTPRGQFLRSNDDGQQDWMATYFPLKLIVPF